MVYDYTGFVFILISMFQLEVSETVEFVRGNCQIVTALCRTCFKQQGLFLYQVCSKKVYCDSKCFSSEYHILLVVLVFSGFLLEKIKK